MSPLLIFMLCISLKCVKVEEISLSNEDAGKLTSDEELRELTEDGYYEYSIDEEGHEVNYMSIRIFTKLEFRIAVKDRKRFWTNGIVPYVISKNYDPDQKKVILEGMDAFKNRTCIRFTQRKDESAFIFIQPGFGCSATIGKVNTNIVKLSNGCYQKGIVIHELMHVLGFLHEQSRSDRDKFVKINFDNINEKQRKNFDKFPEFLIQTGNISYDYGSIMHYGPFTFAKNKSIPTIIPLQKNVTIGQRLDFSKKDIAKINIFYNCTKQGKKRVKRHDDGAPSAYIIKPTNSQQSRVVPPAYPSNARKVEYGPEFAPADYSLPKFSPVRHPAPDHRPVYPPQAYPAPIYSQEERPRPPLSPLSYSQPEVAPAAYEWPAYSPVEPPKPVYRPAEQPKVSYFPESLYAPAIHRRLNYSSEDYRRVQEGYYAPPPAPPRSYRKPEYTRPSYTTAGYHILRYPPIDYPQKFKDARQSYTTAGYRRPSYAPAYPKLDYPKVYPNQRYVNDRYPPVMKPYTLPNFDTTVVTISPLNNLTTTTDVITTATTNTAPNTDDTTPTRAETTTAAPTSTPAPTTTSVPTSTAAVTTTAAPTSTVLQTTTAAPTSTVLQTTTAAPTSTVLQTTTAAPTSTVLQTTTAAPTSTIEETTTAIPETTADPTTTTQEQTSTIITTVGVTETTEIKPTSYISLYPVPKPYSYDLTSRNSELFGNDEDTHSIGYHKIHVFPDIESRTALRDPTALWNRGIVPYEFSDKYDMQQKGFLLEAMQEFHAKTCIRFVPRQRQQSYIFVEPEVKCSAQIGRVPGSVNNVKISEGCYLQGTIIHELMHILGFVHEQDRPDRDQYVMIIWDNIIPEAKKNFRKYTWEEVQDLGQGYDYGSVMHYGNNEFAEDPDRPTIVPLQAGVKLGQRDGFSPKDIAKINTLYNCRMEQERQVVTASPVEEFKKYFQSNIQRLFRNLLRAIQNFRPSKPKNH